MPESAPRKLVLCFDGTWNDWKSNTNVARIYSEIADESTGCPGQRKFYDEGVGTQWYDRFRGGAFGYGLDRNIRLGYAWLSSVYETATAEQLAAASGASATHKPNGDLLTTPAHSPGVEFVAGSDIFIMGFSRGAFTARSLGGIINYLGIPKIDAATIDRNREVLADHPIIQEAWDLYVARPTTAEQNAIENGSADAALVARARQHEAAVTVFRARTGTRYPVRLHFIGVWDTVGSLGIPRVFDRNWLPRFSTRYQFHDTALGASVRNAFHAVAIDEHRLPYKATLWTEKKHTTEKVEQRWFPGAHADIGGGYEDGLLPAPPLKWLADQAAACGLEFVNDRRLSRPDGGIDPSIASAPAAFDLDGTEHLSAVHDSYAGFMLGTYRVLRSIPGMGGRVYRRMLVLGDGVNQKVDESAFQKWKADPEYRPLNLGQAGRTEVTFNVARDEEYVDVVVAVATEPD